MLTQYRTYPVLCIPMWSNPHRKYSGPTCPTGESVSYHGPASPVAHTMFPSGCRPPATHSFDAGPAVSSARIVFPGIASVIMTENPE